MHNVWQHAQRLNEMHNVSEEIAGLYQLSPTRIKRKGQGESLGPFGLIRREDEDRATAKPGKRRCIAFSARRCSEASSPTPCYYLDAVLSKRSEASSPTPYLFPVILLKD